MMSSIKSLVWPTRGRCINEKVRNVRIGTFHGCREFGQAIRNVIQTKKQTSK